MEVIGLVASIITIVVEVKNGVQAVKALNDQVQGAEVYLLSLMAQLNSIAAAFAQIHELIQTADYDRPLQMDLELSVDASRIHMEYINSKISKLRRKNAGSALKLRSKIRVAFETEGMDACLQRLNHQATALNLLITVLMSKSVNEQNTLLRRSKTRKVFQKVRDDKASVIDETASMMVLRDASSIRDAVFRSQSEPVLSMGPWRRFSFDDQVLDSKAYGSNLPRRHLKESDMAVEDVIGSDSDSVDDQETLFDDADLPPELSKRPTTTSPSEAYADATHDSPRISRMLAISHEECNFQSIIAQAQQLWNAPKCEGSPLRMQGSWLQTYRLHTGYFDLGIDSHTLRSHNVSSVDEDLLASYEDVSNILFAAHVSVYSYDAMRLEKDLSLFARIANNYHVRTAKIVLFLDTTDLEYYDDPEICNEIKEKFLDAGHAGASNGSIYVVTGEADEATVGRIFELCNETGAPQANQYAGLSRGMKAAGIKASASSEQVNALQNTRSAPPLPPRREGIPRGPWQAGYVHQEHSETYEPLAEAFFVSTYTPDHEASGFGF